MSGDVDGERGTTEGRMVKKVEGRRRGEMSINVHFSGNEKEDGFSSVI